MKKKKTRSDQIYNNELIYSQASKRMNSKFPSVRFNYIQFTCNETTQIDKYVIVNDSYELLDDSAKSSQQIKSLHSNERATQPQIASNISNHFSDDNRII